MCARARLGAQAVEHERDDGRVLDMLLPVGGVGLAPLLYAAGQRKKYTSIVAATFLSIAETILSGIAGALRGRTPWSPECQGNRGGTAACPV